MTEQGPTGIEDVRSVLRMLLAMCERLQAEMSHAQTWDNRKPTFFYLERNMQWAREVLESTSPKDI